MKNFRLLVIPLVIALALSPVAPVLAADLSITAASVLESGSAKHGSGVAGTTITAGKLLYKKASDGKIYLADADLVTDSAYKVIGIATNGATAGQWFRFVTEDPALTIGGTVAAGSVYILSATAGGLAPVADAATGMYVSTCFLATSATVGKFKILRSDVAKP